MAAIDSSPLSASSIERRNSLEKRLQLRPEAQDLRNRHILVGEGVAPYALLSPISTPPLPLFYILYSGWGYACIYANPIQRLNGYIEKHPPQISTSTHRVVDDQPPIRSVGSWRGGLRGRSLLGVSLSDFFFFFI